MLSRVILYIDENGHCACAVSRLCGRDGASS